MTIFRLVTPAIVGIGAVLLSTSSPVLAMIYDIDFYFDPGRGGFGCAASSRHNPRDCSKGSSLTYGGCGWIPDGSIVWCCPASGKFCEGGAQNMGCKTDLKHQISCDNGSEKPWCCDGRYETCGTTKDTCFSKFENPVVEYPESLKDYEAAIDEFGGSFTTVYNVDVQGTTVFSLLPTNEPSASLVGGGGRAGSKGSGTGSAGVPDITLANLSEVGDGDENGNENGNGGGSDGGGGISVGAAVGATLAGTLGVAGLVFLAFLYRRNKKKKPMQRSIEGVASDPKHEVDGSPNAVFEPKYELPDNRLVGTEVRG